MTDFSKIVRIGTAATYGGRRYSVYCKIEYRNGRLYITGVEGPLTSGNCIGSAGQIDMNITKYAPGWDAEQESRFREVWQRWNLNNMRSACEHQRARGETYEAHPHAVCGDCGYHLGSAWLKEEVPSDVLSYLASLPDTDRTPAWA